MTTAPQAAAKAAAKAPQPRPRSFLQRPRFWLVFYAVLAVLAVADTFRSPSSQVTGSCYVGLVRVYQAVGRPLLPGRIRCPYTPTCSVYSVEAVQKHGLRSGLVLTYKRLCACTTAVAPGTADPVPPFEP